MAVSVILLPLLLLWNAYDWGLRLRGRQRDLDLKQSYARRHEIERELRMKVPSLSEFEINKIAAAIDKHESFERPQSLRVTAPERWFRELLSVVSKNDYAACILYK